MIRRGAETLRVALETQRLLLEPVSVSHAPGLYDAVVSSRPELLPWMPWAREPTLEGNLTMALRDEKAWDEGRVYRFAVLERESDQVLGVAGLNREGEDVAELHYWIRTSHAGRGLTTEAGRTLVGWARDELHLGRLTLWAGRDNLASRRVAEKLGFVHLGPLDWRPEGGLGDFDAESYELFLSP
jgi:RimJ/RimL family protein N-acetyltransferase